MAILSEQSDLELIELIKLNNEQALRFLYDRYWEQLYISAFNLVKNKEVAEDILQEVFIAVWTKRDKLKIKTSLKAYLYTSVLYKSYDHFRKNSKLIKVELLKDFNTKIQNSTPESKLIHDELVAHVNDAIESLPEKCKEVFKLSREKHLSNKEIAQKLNVSVKTVEAHITKALKVLKGSLSNLASIELIVFLFHDLPL